MLKSLELLGYFDQILHAYLLPFPATRSIQNGERGLLSISLVGPGILKKMLITLYPHGILLSNVAY